jgi:hypothetical protein
LQAGEQYSASLRLGVNGSPQTAQSRSIFGRDCFARYRASAILRRQLPEHAVIAVSFLFAQLKIGRLQLSHGFGERR